MSAPVTRYEVVNTCGGHCFDVQEDKNGEFVDFDAYEALQKRHSVVLAALKGMQALWLSNCNMRGHEASDYAEYTAAVIAVTKATGEAS